MHTTGRALCCLAASALMPFLAGGAPRLGGGEELDGDASSGIALKPPNAGVQAAFAERSYSPGTIATLRFRGSAAGIVIRI
jgi:hypothetical protein